MGVVNVLIAVFIEIQFRKIHRAGKDWILVDDREGLFSVVGKK